MARNATALAREWESDALIRRRAFSLQAATWFNFFTRPTCQLELTVTISQGGGNRNVGLQGHRLPKRARVAFELSTPRPTSLCGNPGHPLDEPLQPCRPASWRTLAVIIVYLLWLASCGFKVQMRNIAFADSFSTFATPKEQAFTCKVGH